MDLEHLKSLPTQQLAEMVGWELRGRPIDTVECGVLRGGLMKNTLEIERCKGKGPPYMQERPGSRVTYLERDVLLWMLAGRRRHTGQAHNAKLHEALFA